MGGIIRDGPVEALKGDTNMLAFRDFLRDPKNHHSFFDGGQMMYRESSRLYGSEHD
jgi:hypothetical protein